MHRLLFVLGAVALTFGLARGSRRRRLDPGYAVRRRPRRHADAGTQTQSGFQLAGSHDAAVSLVRVKLSPTTVENYLQSTAIDIGLPGYDECFGNGRIDALRAVLHDTSGVYDAAAPFCPEYSE